MVLITTKTIIIIICFFNLMYGLNKNERNEEKIL
jgi:hypothetical protein